MTMMIRPTRSALWAAALMLSIGIVLFGNVATDLILGDSIWSGTLGSIDRFDVALLHLFFTGLPFFVLAAKDDRRLAMWVTAVVLTVAFWIYFNWQIWQDSLIDFAGGANIGLGLVMIAAPFFILVILKLVSMISRASVR